MGGSNGIRQDLTNRPIGRARAYGMEVHAEKSKVMTNSINDISADVSLNGQKLEGWQRWPDQTGWVKQHYQLHKQVVEVSGHLHPSLGL